MWRGIINYAWYHDIPNYGFMGDKRGAAIDILALAVTLLCLIRYAKTAPRVRCMSAFRAIHHIRFSAAVTEIASIIHNTNIENQLFNIEIVNFYFQFDAGHKSAIRVDRVR